MENLNQAIAGSWQDWIFVWGYLGFLGFVAGMVLLRSRRNL
jgi:hypothetical protein